MAWLRGHLFAVLLIVAVLGLLPSYLWPYSLTGASAAPTILLRDTFVVNRAAYDLRLPYSRVNVVRIGSPQRGDIVQAYLPQGIGLAIKRAVGLPGEIVEIRENRVLINGRELPLRPLDRADFYWVPDSHHIGSSIAMEENHWIAFTPGNGPYRNCAPVHLDAGQYFLMGDNRDNSFDSRAFGPVSREKIVAKVIAALPRGPRLAKRN